MKKIGNFIIKLLVLVILLLILITVSIFIYPKFADKTQLDDKLVSFIANKVSTASGNDTGTEVGTSISGNHMGTEVGTTGGDYSSQIILPQKEVEEKIQEDSRTQTWSQEEKDALKNAYSTVLHKMGLNTKNLNFYEMKNLDGDTYYAFQVLDDFNGPYEHLLLYDPDTYHVYWHDEKGNLNYANSTDSIFSGTIEGNTEVDYDDTLWKKVLEGYMDAILKDRDNDKASTYVDSSCYYLAALSELRREDFVDATVTNQEALIKEVVDVDSRKNSKYIDDYKWSYQIYDTEEYIDEYNLDWIEAHIVVDLDTTSDNEKDAYRDYYCVHLREYSYGWRVAAFTKE